MGVAVKSQVVSERQLIDRVSNSDLFAKSPRLREFLLYVAECTLENRLADTREQIVAERVFGRKPDAAGQDTIVRTEARNLRKRLELYFATEGVAEPLVVTMPKGGYSLAFTPRQTSEVQKRARLPLVPIWSALVLVALALLAWRLWGSQRRVLPFSALLESGHNVMIVTSDTGMLQIATLLHHKITVDEYIARNYAAPSAEPRPIMEGLKIWQFTDAREMTMAGSLLIGMKADGDRITLRSGHDVQLQNFKDQNAILIGSSVSNPWAQLFEDKLNFSSDLLASGLITFHNRSPRAGEQQIYPSQWDFDHKRAYARIAFLPRTSGAGAVLLIAGNTAQGTQAAGEFILDRPALVKTLRDAGVNPYGPPRYFEILLRSTNFVGGAISSEIVAVRTSPVPD